MLKATGVLLVFAIWCVTGLLLNVNWVLIPKTDQLISKTRVAYVPFFIENIYVHLGRPFGHLATGFVLMFVGYVAFFLIFLPRVPIRLLILCLSSLLLLLLCIAVNTLSVVVFRIVAVVARM